jgi:hypothetical protein
MLETIRKVCNSATGVIPAEAGIQSGVDLPRVLTPWIPASAGMTGFCRPSLAEYSLETFLPPALRTLRAHLPLAHARFPFKIIPPCSRDIPTCFFVNPDTQTKIF